MNTVTTNEIIYTNKELESIVGKIIKDKLNSMCKQYKPLCDAEINVSDIAFMIHANKNAVYEVLEYAVISEKQDTYGVSHKNQKIYEAVKNLFCDNKIELILYKNNKYRYGVEYRIEAARLKEIYQSMIQYAILPKRHSSKKSRLSINVKYETFTWLNQTAMKDNKSIADVIDKLVQDASFYPQTRGISDGVNNVSDCNCNRITENINETLNGTDGTLNGTLNGTLKTKILMAIRANPKITEEMLSTNISIPIRTIKRYIANLKKSRVLERIGSKKFGYWEIIKNDLSNIY